MTGRSGTGKSYAAGYLHKLGIAVIDGDAVAREVVEPGQAALTALEKAFGPDIIQIDGTLDRRRLADIAFADPDQKRLLDKTIHPFIIDRLLQMFDDMKNEGIPYCIVEAGALVESGLYAVCDRIILITADEQTAIDRIMRRDGITHEQARTRLAAQMSEAEVREICDVMLSNDGTLREFEDKLDVLARQLDSWFQSE